MRWSTASNKKYAHRLDQRARDALVKWIRSATSWAPSWPSVHAASPPQWQQKPEDQEALRGLRRRLVDEYRVPPPRVYSITHSRRAHHALVDVRDGNVEQVIKQLRKEVSKSGVHALLRHNSPLFEYRSPGQRRRWKREKARRRTQKNAARRAAWEEVNDWR
jgi:ribosomal protein S21